MLSFPTIRRWHAQARALAIIHRQQRSQGACCSVGFRTPWGGKKFHAAAAQPRALTSEMEDSGEILSLNARGFALEDRGRLA